MVSIHRFYALVVGWRTNTALDIYVACVSSAHNVCPQGYWVAIVSTIAETSANHHIELQAGLDRLGKIEEQFMVCCLSECISMYWLEMHFDLRIFLAGPPYPHLRATRVRKEGQHLHFSQLRRHEPLRDYYRRCQGYLPPRHWRGAQGRGPERGYLCCG